MAHRFLLLDAIRGIAALLIVIRHTTAFWNGDPFQESYLAVDLFFCLSGFVLAHSYEKRISDGLSVSRFMAIRLVRLYPLYLLGSAIAAASFGALIAAGRLPTTMAQLSFTGVLSLFMLPSPQTLPAPRWWGPLYPLNNPAWSLLLDLLANAALALIVRHRLHALRIYVGILLLSAWGLVLVALVWPSALDAGTQWRTLWMGFPRVGWSFFAGVLAHHLYTNSLAELPSATSFRGALSVIAIVLCLTFSPSASWRWVYDVIAVILIFPICVYSAARCRVPVWTWPICSALGATSYAVYMLHEPLGRVVQRLAGAAGFPVESSAPWSGLIFAGLLVVLCRQIDRFYDVPFRRAATSWLDALRAGHDRRIGGKVG